MPEIYPVVEKQSVVFEGLFKPNELMNIIKNFISERGYIPVEKKNEEEVYEHGIQSHIELKPYKNINEYLLKQLWINIDLYRVKEKFIEVDSIKKKYYEGKVSIVVDGVIVSKLKIKWENAGWLYFIRILYDKFIKKDFVSKLRAEVAKDANDLLLEVKSFLNMTRFFD